VIGGGGTFLFALLGTFVGGVLKNLTQWYLTPNNQVTLTSIIPFSYHKSRYLVFPKYRPWCELGSGFAFALFWWQFGPTVELGIASLYFCVLMAISLIDLDRRLVPNKIVYPALVISLGVTFITTSGAGLVDALMSGGLLFLTMFPFALLKDMGWGDVKLAGLVGVMTGFPGSLVALFTAALAGGLAAILLLALKVKGRNDAIPLAPVLSLGCVISMLWTNALMAWWPTLN